MDQHQNMLEPPRCFLDIIQLTWPGSLDTQRYMEENPDDPDVRIIQEYAEYMAGAKQE